MIETKFGKPSQMRSLAKPAAMVDASGSDGRQTFGEGDVLFSQGDPGGDLFFVEAGTVEIFTRNGDETIVLSEMQPGEIIGVMTLLTSEPRMASARAKTSVRAKRVPHTSIKRVLQTLPNWMKIVLKEFTLRLTHMNKIYSEAVLRMKRLEATQITSVYSGAQLASAFGTVAEFMAINVDGQKFVVVDDVLQKLEFVLNIPKSEIDRIFGILLEAGLLRTEIEPDRKRTVTKLDSAQKLAYFAQFVRESKHGPTKKLLRAKFSHKETRVMSAMVKFAARLNMDLEKTCKFVIPELKRAMERVTGVKFESEALKKGVDLKLIAIVGDGEQETVVLKPSQLGRTVACLEAIRKLTNADDPGERQRPAA